MRKFDAELIQRRLGNGEEIPDGVGVVLAALVIHIARVEQENVCWKAGAADNEDEDAVGAVQVNADV